MASSASATAARAARPAVFLDRDGTINEDVGYLSELAHLTLYPWAIDAIRLLKRAGYLVVMVTNQGGIGRRMIRPDFPAQLHAAIDARLLAAGTAVDGWYLCPHHPEALVDELRQACRCRKPEPGMALDAARDLAIDLSRSWVIGDKWIDVQLAERVGGRGVLVRTGWGVIEEGVRAPGQRVEAICDSLAGAVSVVLAADDGGPAAVAPGR